MVLSKNPQERIVKSNFLCSYSGMRNHYMDAAAVHFSQALDSRFRGNDWMGAWGIADKLLPFKYYGATSNQIAYGLKEE